MNYRGERLQLDSDRLGCEAGTVQQAWTHLRDVSQSVSQSVVKNIIISH